MKIEVATKVTMTNDDLTEQQHFHLFNNNIWFASKLTREENIQ